MNSKSLNSINITQNVENLKTHFKQRMNHEILELITTITLISFFLVILRFDEILTLLFTKLDFSNKMYIHLPQEKLKILSRELK